MSPDETRLRALWTERVRQINNEYTEQLAAGDNLRALYVDGQATAYRKCLEDLESVSTGAAPAQVLEQQPWTLLNLIGAIEYTPKFMAKFVSGRMDAVEGYEECLVVPWKDIAPILEEAEASVTAAKAEDE